MFRAACSRGAGPAIPVWLIAWIAAPCDDRGLCKRKKGRNPMKPLHIFLLTAMAAGIAAAGPLLGQEGRMLDTMPHGTYECALPGDAAGLAYEVVEEEGFAIGPASSYSNEEGSGVYLMKGRELVFTRGPKKGERFKRVGRNQLQAMDEKGELGRLLCTRLGSTG